MKKLIIILILICSFQGFGQIVGYWRLNGNSNDASGNGYNGTDTNVTYSRANGVLNGGAGFNGSTSISRMGSTPTMEFGTTPFTMSFLMKTSYSGTSYDQIIIRRDNELGADRRFFSAVIGNSSVTAGKIEFFIYDKGNENRIYSTVAVNDGKWHHVACVRNSSNVNIFLDGILNSQGSSTGLSVNGTSNVLVFGGNHNYSTSRYYGAIDEAIIDNISWTPAKVKNEYSRIKGFF